MSPVGTSIAVPPRVNPSILLGKACLVLQGELTSLGRAPLEQAGMRAKRTCTADAALHEIATTWWDALVVDLDVPGAIEVLRCASSSSVGGPAILTTSLERRQDAVVEASAFGLPFIPPVLLMNALQVWVAAALNAQPAHERRAVVEHSREGRRRELSPREAAVFSLLTRGQAPKEIAHALGITHETVRTYARKAYRKMGVSNLREAMASLLDG